MARPKPLTAAHVRNFKLPKDKAKARMAMGGNLYLLARRESDGQRLYWCFRYSSGGKAREMGLGSADGHAAVTLADARKLALKHRSTILHGGDPLAEKQAKRAKHKADTLKAVTFEQAAKHLLVGWEKDWKSDIHRRQWRQSLEDYVYPKIGHIPVNDVATPDVLAVLRQPIKDGPTKGEQLWTGRRETARRVRMRIETILEAARTEGWREDKSNPARWKNHLDTTLRGKRNRKPKVRHHPAAPWSEMPTIFRKLGKVPGTAAKALAFTLLTAARTSETLLATWAEIDLPNAVWTLPGDRTKSEAAHRIPLSKQAMAILHAVKPLRGPDDLVFPSEFEKVEKPGHRFELSDMAMLMTIRRVRPGITVHGTARSTLRDWCADHGISRDVAEALLNHVVGDETERAYFRSDIIDIRRDVLQRYADFVLPPGGAADNVEDFEERRKRAGE